MGYIRRDGISSGALQCDGATGGVILPPLSLKDVTNHDDVAFSRAFGGKQPRGKRIPPLVSEFKSIIELVGPKNDMPPDRIKTEWLLPPTISSNAAFISLPAGCRVVRSHFYKGEVGRTDISDHQHFLCEQGITIQEGDQCNIDDKNASYRCIVGVPWTAEEFMFQAANHARHPRNLIEGVPIDIKRCIEHRSNCTTEALAAERTAVMRKWMTELVACMDEEKSYKDGMSPHRAKVLSTKRLVLFRRMLVENIRNGFDLVGDIPKSSIYKKRVKPATITPDELHSSAKRTRKAIIHSTTGSDDSAVDIGVYQSTLDEMERGWLHGPYMEHQLEDDCTVTRRFGVRQGSKIRPIDNYTESLVNQTTSAGEAISLHSTDVIAATLSLWMSVMSKQETNETKLDLVGKSYDLHKAYKHLCISDKGLKDAYICVFNPTSKRVELFGQYVLPFGACASVHGFCRTSYGLWTIGVRLLSLLWTVYFDDFVVFEERPLSRHCEFVVSTFFKMLGWATSIDKETEFSGSLKALGILIDLSEVKLLKIHFSNTDERRFEVTHDIKAILKAGNSAGAKAKGFVAVYSLRSRRSMAGDLFDRCRFCRGISTIVLRLYLMMKPGLPSLFFATNWSKGNRDAFHRWLQKLFICIVMQAMSLTVTVLQALVACCWILMTSTGPISVNSSIGRWCLLGIMLEASILSMSLSSSQFLLVLRCLLSIYNTKQWWYSQTMKAPLEASLVASLKIHLDRSWLNRYATLKRWHIRSSGMSVSTLPAMLLIFLRETLICAVLLVRGSGVTLKWFDATLTWLNHCGDGVKSW